MSSFDRRTLLVAPVALAACGFRPVYGPGSAGAALQNRVQMATPTDREGFLLVQRLEERLGRAADPTYFLALDLDTRIEGLGIDPEGNTDRANLIGVAGYVLTDDATGNEVSSGIVNSFTGYSTAGSTVEVLAAQRDARERLMVILADQIVTRLLASSVG
jgi:LPS-assembly lipoprotein